MASKGRFGSGERFIDRHVRMGEANEPEAALNRANARLQQTAAQMSPARRIMPAHVIAVIPDWTWLHARPEQRGMEDEPRALRLQRDGVLHRQLLQSSHQAPAEILHGGGVAVAERQDFI